MKNKNLFISRIRQSVLFYTGVLMEKEEISNTLDEMMSTGFYYSIEDINSRSDIQIIKDFINYGIIGKPELLRNLNRRR